MFLWDLFVTNPVVIIIIFLLTASRPSDALPVDALLHKRPAGKIIKTVRCKDRKLPPCICPGPGEIGLGEPIDISKCGPNVFDFRNDPSEPPELMSWARHLFFWH
jgi:hypothetical protein